MNFQIGKLIIQEKWFIFTESSLPVTAVRLGQLITDPQKPEQSLQKSSLDIESFDMTVDSHIETNFVFESRTKRILDLGFSASVLSLIPAGLAGKRHKYTSYRYE